MRNDSLVMQSVTRRSDNAVLDSNQRQTQSSAESADATH